MTTTLSTIETQGPDGHPVAVTFAIARVHGPEIPGLGTAARAWAALPYSWTILAGIDGEYLVTGIERDGLTLDSLERRGQFFGVRFEVVDLATAIEFIRERSI